MDGLHLCPNEVHPTSRQTNVSAPNPLIVQDMSHMCKFVYDFYAPKVAAMSQISAQNVPKIVPKLDESKVTEAKAEGKTGQHPADDRDSDEEMEEPKFKEIVNEVTTQ